MAARSIFIETAAAFARQVDAADEETIVAQACMQIGARTLLRALIASNCPAFGREELRLLEESTERCIEIVTAAAARRCINLPEDL